MSQVLTDGNDYVTATESVVYALDGNDRIFATNLSSVIYGGSGSDFIGQNKDGQYLDGFGGYGNDTIHG